MDKITTSICLSVLVLCPLVVVYDNGISAASIAVGLVWGFLCFPGVLLIGQMIYLKN